MDSLTGTTPTPGRRYRVEWSTVTTDAAPADVFAQQYAGRDGAFWLDSASADGGRWSIVGAADGVLSHTVRYRLGDGAVTVTGTDGRRTAVPGDVFTFLSDAVARFAVEPGDVPSPFALGYVGYLGYELRGDSCEMPVSVRSEHDDAFLVLAERALVFDARTGQVHALALVCDDDALTSASRRWLQDTTTWLAADRPGERSATPVPAAPALPDVPAPPMPLDTIEQVLEFRHPRREYLALVERCLEHIRRGESYEICLTNTLRTGPLADPWATYQRLRSISPVPYGAYLQCGGTTVLSASPERFLAVSRTGDVETRPIKGTRPRGRTPREDDLLRADLLASEKDRAENLMIVDLMRNDLSRVCTTGSVHVEELFAVETYPLVHQLVSSVRGHLRPDRTAVDCVRAAFPGGSMTGAPKRRTLEILEELEGGPRGVYSGALGWFSLDGAADLSIVIRTIVADASGTTLGVGGAITALSDPAAEYAETLVKARAMAAALVDGPAPSPPVGHVDDEA
ncbi:aminodeoxychorismate synthase component I [Cellulomonas chitinilytica]|uniref:aminodeoxychorismate synthase component I n=1 Tax=Cellulomonas chitinilytica TaxID=398759 RepID=UPI0019432870|nr:aminodeoxychorismate synthase component I [Cellulomonas chitinilytica]